MTAISVSPAMLRSPIVRRRATSVAIAIVILGIWQLLAVTVFSGKFVVPAPGDVVMTAIRDHFYWNDAAVTLNISWKGWLIGNGTALFLAAICLMIPFAESGLLTLGVATYCVPTIAIGPLLVVIEGSYGAKVVMSALSVFFVTLVAAITGLRAASPRMLEAVTAFGGTPWQQLVKVRVRASLPSLASGLAISAPAAILGTMIGDYLGGDEGLGVVMLQSQQSLDVNRTWAIALVTTIICGVAFAVVMLIARRLGAHVEAPLDSGLTRKRTSANYWKRFGVGTVRVVGTVVFALIVWEILVGSSGLSSYFVKTPLDVWRYIFNASTGAADRQILFSGLAQTMKDATFGWFVGTVTAFVVASLLILKPALNAAIMPFVIVLRSVPLIAMCPLIGLVFGRGLLGVTLIAAGVTFVPSLVTIIEGLKTAPTAALDIVHCGGGSPLATLLKVRIPFCTPSIFAAAKISMPGAVLGSVLAEWLITGHGLGYAMAYDVISSDYANLWASIAVVSAVSLALYAIVACIESSVRSRVWSN